MVKADANTLIDHTRVEHNAGDGIGITATAALTVATIRNSVMAGNGQGGLAVICPPGSGLTRVVVEDSILSMNAGDGAFVGGVETGEVSTTFRRNTLARNGLSGVSVFPGGPGLIVKALLFDNTFVSNPAAAIKAENAGPPRHRAATSSRRTAHCSSRSIRWPVAASPPMATIPA